MVCHGNDKPIRGGCNIYCIYYKIDIMCIFAKYKDIFGKPGTGTHSYRILNIAVVDVSLTVISSFMISWLTGYSIRWVLLFMFILGIVLHRLFCVNSTVNKFIFGEV